MGLCGQVAVVIWVISSPTVIYWSYYKGIFPMAFTMGLLATALFGLSWGYMLFVTLAPFLAHYAYGILRKNERIFYLNLGIPRYKLLWGSLLIQLVISIPLFALLIAAFSLFFGDLPR
jgi:hypothetical protein